MFKVLKANRVNLWRTSFLGVLKGAEPKSEDIVERIQAIRMRYFGHVVRMDNHRLTNTYSLLWQSGREQSQRKT